MHDLAFLINPVSGGGVGRGVYQRLEEILDSFGIARETWTAELTENDSLVEQADRLLRSTRKLIAVGGDGTLGIVLDRVRRSRPGASIGLIPLGTGNDLGRALGVFRVYDAKGLVACLKHLLKAPDHAFDLWDAGGDATLVSYLSTGIDAGVLRAFDRARKQKGLLRGGAAGNKLYYLRAFAARLGDRIPAGARAMLDTPEGPVELSLSGARAFVAANINSYAAGARFFPGSRFDDGLLEIVVFDALWKYVLLGLGSRVLPGMARWMRRWVPRYRARSLKLFLPPGTPVQIDGEDFTDRFPAGGLEISLAARVRLLDLRRSFYALF